MARPLRLLLVEDNPGDAGLIEAMLEDVEQLQMDWVDSLEAGVQKMTGEPYDAILLDLSLPDSDGLDSVSTTVLFDALVPVIVLTGLASEEMAVESLRAGAQDYLVKGTIDGPVLLRTIRYAIERRAVQQALAQAREPEVAPAHVQAVLIPRHAGNATAHVCQLEDRDVVLVCLDAGASMAQNAVHDAGVSTKRIHFIDASGRGGQGDARVHVLDDAQDLDLLSLEIERACAALGPDVRVVVDSINALLKHHRLEATAAFLHRLTNRLRLLGIDADFLAHENEDWPFVEGQLPFLDATAL